MHPKTPWSWTFINEFKTTLKNCFSNNLSTKIKKFFTKSAKIIFQHHLIKITINKDPING